MKILKALCHLGVDRMLKAALGADLTVYRPRKPDGTFKDLVYWVGDVGFPTVEEVGDEEWDIVIIDDIPTAEALKHVKAKHRVWYIHGTYHTWKGFQDYANLNFQDVHVLFPDVSRREYIESWYQHKPLSQLVLPIHLTDHYYSVIPPERNGRCYVMGNEIMHAASLYGNIEMVQEVLDRLQSYPFDLYGFNAKPPVPAQFFRGSAGSIRDVAREYSVSVHPSHVKTLSFVLVESMAAGVPVITTPKEDLPERHSGNAYVIARTADEFLHWTEKLLNDEALSLKMGEAGQKFLWNQYPFFAYRYWLKGWLEGIGHS